MFKKKLPWWRRIFKSNCAILVLEYLASLSRNNKSRYCLTFYGREERQAWNFRRYCCSLRAQQLMGRHWLHSSRVHLLLAFQFSQWSSGTPLPTSIFPGTGPSITLGSHSIVVLTNCIICTSNFLKEVLYDLQGRHFTVWCAVSNAYAIHQLHGGMASWIHPLQSLGQRFFTLRLIWSHKSRSGLTLCKAMTLKLDSLRM